MPNEEIEKLKSMGDTEIREMLFGGKYAQSWAAIYVPYDKVQSSLQLFKKLIDAVRELSNGQKA